MSTRGGNGRRRSGSAETRSLIARRRPSRPAESDASPEEAASRPEAPPPAAAEPDPAAEQKAPRRRRSRAAKTEAAETPPETAAPAPDTDAAEQKTPRRRRSRAAQAEATETAPEAAAPAPDTDAAEQKTPRRRRSRAAQAEAAETAPETAAPAPGGGAAEPGAAEAPPAPPAPAPPAPAPPAPAPPAPSRRRTSDALAAVEERIGRLEQLGTEIASQRSAIVSLAESIDELAVRLDRAARKPRLGVFVDVPNVLYGVESGAPPIDMGKLLAMLSEGRDVLRATAYAPVSDDPREPVEQQKFVAPFVRHAYRIVTKPLKRFADGSVKGNFDVEMAIDLVTMSERLDVVTVVSGDSDFARAVEIVQSRGVRVEVAAFAGSTSVEMRALADHYVELDRFAAQLR